MPRQNRVTPEGEILSLPWRGQFMGNRGILHRDGQGALGAARWRHPHWVTCTLHLRPGALPHPVSAPGRYTPLFFPDEAVASAAGHRPCVLCRRAVWQDFAAAWGRAFGAEPRAPEVDRVLHEARAPKRRGAGGRPPSGARDEPHPTDQGLADHGLAGPEVFAGALPFGAFFRHEGRALLRLDAQCRAFEPSSGGYGAPEPLPRQPVTLLTPAPLVAVMAAGWRPVLTAAEDRPGWAWRGA